VGEKRFAIQIFLWRRESMRRTGKLRIRRVDNTISLFKNWDVWNGFDYSGSE
jgi:membrane-bound lytic murein transglycosylase MltF